MVLVDIDTLTDSELRVIAQQLDVEDWESLSREDLIESIEDSYDDEGASERITDPSATGHRYVKTLTSSEYQGSFGFPGVEELPASYNETSIYLLLRDANWAYAFWNVSPNNMAQVEEKGSELVLRISVLGKEGKQEDSFDIGIAKEDVDWCVELPWTGKEYRASLVAQKGGKEEVLAQSNVVAVQKSWLSSHIDALNEPGRFNLLVSSLVTKEGSVINNRQVRVLLEQYRNMDKEAK